MRLTALVALALVMAGCGTDPAGGQPDGGIGGTAGGGAAGSGGIGASDAGGAAGAGATGPAPAQLLWQLQLEPTPTAGENAGYSPSATLDDLITDASGNVYLVADVHGDLVVNGQSFPNPYGTSYPGQGAAFLAKLDPTGKLVWGARLPSSQLNASLLLLPNGDLFLMGGFPAGNAPLDFFGAQLSGPAANEICMARLSNDGQKLWSACGDSWALANDETKCDLRFAGATLDGDGVVAAGVIFQGKCTLPGQTQLPWMQVQTGWVARFTTSAPMTTAFTTFPLPAGSSAPWWTSALRPITLFDGSVFVGVGASSPLTIGGVKMGALPVLARLDTQKADLSPTIVRDLPLLGGLWSPGPDNSIAISGLATDLTPFDFGAGPIDTSQGGVPFFARWSSTGSLIAGKTYGPFGVLSLDLRPLQPVALPGRMAVLIPNASSKDEPFFGGPPISESGDHAALVLLGNDGDFERAEVSSKVNVGASAVREIHRAAPMDAQGETLVIGGSVAGTFQFLGATFDALPDFGPSTWIVAAKLPK